MITIAAESPLQPDIRALLQKLNKTLLALTPAEFCYHMTAEEMAQPHTTVFVARENGAAVAMGSLRRHGGGVGEVKRMYTLPSHQGRGLGGRVLDEIERTARAEGIARLVLETGEGYIAAARVYERAGFTRCGRVLDYPESPYTAFYEKLLLREASAA